MMEISVCIVRVVVLHTIAPVFSRSRGHQIQTFFYILTTYDPISRKINVEMGEMLL